MENGHHGTELPTPRSIEEVEALIHQLYQPGNQQNVPRIQETLQRVQRSSEGWQLANTLLERPDEKVQFFGALTFIVKLNSDSQNLSHEDANALLLRLINWLIHVLNHSTGPLVARKLCSALVTYFLHFSESWTKCIPHLIVSLYANQAVEQEAMAQAPAISALVENLAPEKLVVALWFSSALVEEVSRTDSNSMKTYKFHTRLLENVDDLVALIGTGFSKPDSIKVRQESVNCFQSWITYSHRAWIDEGIKIEPLQNLTQTAIRCLTDPDMYEATSELFADILSNYSRFFKPEDLQLLSSLLASPWAQEKYNALIEGDFSFEYQQFGQLMIAHGDATVEDLVRNTDQVSQQFVGALGGLLTAEGYAVAEDQIFVLALEFWSTFVEVMIDSLYSDEGQNAPWIETAQSHVMRAIESCWKKIQYPSSEEYSSWDSVDKQGFIEARKDVADLLQSSYTLTGPPLFSMFGRLILQSLNSHAWPELEASLYCLSALADSISEDEACNEVLDSVFGSDLFVSLIDPSAAVPQRTKKTALTTIEKYADYFQRRPQTLPGVLGFLYQALDNHSLALAASRSIHSICGSCRKYLTSQLGAFFEMYSKSMRDPSRDYLIKERVLGAMAAIIQALPSDQAKLQPLAHLLDLISVDVVHVLAVRDGTAGNAEDPNRYGVASMLASAVLASLTAVGKALQSPTDSIDLENESIKSEFWTAGPGAAIQSKIKNIFETLLAAFPNDGGIIDQTCHVFRAGFTEDEGPFVFTPQYCVEFVLRFDINTQRLGSVMSMASSVISSHCLNANGTSGQLLTQLLAWNISLLQSLSDPNEDPEITQGGIEFTYRLLPKNVRVLIEQPPAVAEFIFMFTLRTLTQGQPLSKAAAADFWTAFTSMTNESPEIQEAINKIMTHVGPLLAQALIYNIGGNALRSDLDKQAEPLKKLVVRQPQAKQWLESALFKDLRNDKVSEADRRTFLQKIINLRGNRSTNGVVREFWLACRGSNFAYTS